MLYKTIMAAGIVAAGTSMVQAQGFSGGTLGIDYENYSDNDQLGSVNYFGGLEYAITNSISFGANIATYSFEDVDGNNWNYTLHGIYDVGNGIVAGGYLGQDRYDDGELTNYGVEGKMGFGAATAEAYLGRGEDDDDTATYFGVSGNYPIASGFGVMASYDLVSLDDADLDTSKIAIGGEYVLDSGPSFYATVGRAYFTAGDVDTDENFIGVGAKINFGAGNGTTFGTRSLYDIVPGG